MRRGTLVLVGVALLFSAGALVGLNFGNAQGPATPYGRLQLQVFGWQEEDVTITDVTTEPTEWSEVPGLSDLEVCYPVLGASATVAMELTGAPIQVRVRINDQRGKRAQTLEPGPVVFDPAASDRNSFSFTFFKPPGQPRHNFVSAEWRSTSEDPTTLHKGSLQVLYDRDKGRKC